MLGAAIVAGAPTDPAKAGTFQKKRTRQPLRGCHSMWRPSPLKVKATHTFLPQEKDDAPDVRRIRLAAHRLRKATWALLRGFGLVSREESASFSKKGRWLLSPSQINTARPPAA